MDDIHHTELGHNVSDRIETIRGLLADLQDLDIVDGRPAATQIEDAQSELRRALYDIEVQEEREKAGTVSFEDTPDLPQHGSLAWAVEKLHDWVGQTAIDADTAHDVAAPFYNYINEVDHLELDDDVEHDHTGLMAGDGIHDIATPAADYRGVVRAYSYEPVVTVADLSSHLLELVGEEPGSGGFVGGGFNADSIHRENMDRFEGVFGYDRSKWNSDEQTDSEEEAAA